MFKYKDLRMVFVSIFITLLCIFAIIKFQHDRMKLFIIITLSITVLPTFILRYHASIFDDSVLIYIFKGIGILPQLINYQDLQDYQLISNHIVDITFNNKTKKLYLVNAKAFYQELDTKYKNYSK